MIIKHTSIFFLIINHFVLRVLGGQFEIVQIWNTSVVGVRVFACWEISASDRHSSDVVFDTVVSKIRSGKATDFNNNVIFMKGWVTGFDFSSDFVVFLYVTALRWKLYIVHTKKIKKNFFLNNGFLKAKIHLNVKNNFLIRIQTLKFIKWGVKI